MNRDFPEMLHPRGLSVKTVVSFALTLLLCAVLVCFSALNRMNSEKLKMEQLIADKADAANTVLSRMLEKTQALSAFVVQENGNLEHFELVASALVDDPAILNVLIAPDGIVTHVYPYEVNKAVIGWDYFGEGPGNKEAMLAKETGQLVFGGPFDAVQGQQILVGRRPVYFSSDDGDREFWGLVSVTLKYPQALEYVGLDELSAQGFAYEIWRINPDTGEKQIISGDGQTNTENGGYIEQRFSIQNADWMFRIMSVRRWYQYPDTWIMAVLGLCISFLVAFLVHGYIELNALKNSYQHMSYTDALTGIHNRRYFMENAARQADRVARIDSAAFVILFDVDHFNSINDKNGHTVGDTLLRRIAQCVSGILCSYDMFARYGGEEFVIFVTDTSKEDTLALVERIRTAIEEMPVSGKRKELRVSASFGIAEVSDTADFAKAVERADIALFQAKNAGRNRLVVYGEDGFPDELHPPPTV